MQYEKFIQPKEIAIDERTFAISMIPAVDALAIYNTVAKKIFDEGIFGMMMLPPEVDRKLLGYTALIDGDMKIVPNTDTLLNDMFKGRASDIKRLVVEMVKYNFSFFVNGDLQSLFADNAEKVMESGS